MTTKPTLLIAAFLANSFGFGIAIAETAMFTSQADYISFKNGGSEISDAAQVQLDALAVLLNGPLMQDVCMQLVGHSDSTGRPSWNLSISQLRANRVAEYLSARLVQPGRILDIAGIGSSEPMPEFPDYAREQRRVSIRVRTCLPTGLTTG